MFDVSSSLKSLTDFDDDDERIDVKLLLLPDRFDDVSSAHSELNSSFNLIERVK